jgi:hypothetical protein
VWSVALRLLECLGAVAFYLFAIVRSLFTGPRYLN